MSETIPQLNLTHRIGLQRVKCFIPNENQWTPETTVEETGYSEEQGDQ